MFCPDCGVAVGDDEARCPACDADLRVGVPAKIPNYLAGSVFVTLCCCVPLGIVSLVYSNQVNTKLAAGDVVGAQRASKLTMEFMIVGAVLGLVLEVLYVLSLVGNGFAPK